MIFRRVHHPLALVGALAAVLLVACAGHAGRAPEAPGAAVPVTFTLDRSGYVTFVVEDGAGRRVRNLVAEQFFEAGTHTVPWDGYDEGSAVRYRRSGVGSEYDVERERAPAGTYVVRGLVHDGLQLRYALPVQSPGDPPWHTKDGRGAWLADHNPPMALAVRPDGAGVVVGAAVAETGHTVMWLGPDGRKERGVRLGWEGAYALARDVATDAPVVYAATVQRGRDVRLRALTPDGGDRQAYAATLDHGYPREAGLSLAVYDGVAALSLPLGDAVRFVTVGGDVLGTATIPRPRGLAVDSDGTLYVVSADRLVRYDVDWRAGRLRGDGTVLARGDDLGDPHGLAVGPDGRLYVSDWDAHQVVVLDASGAVQRRIGTPGGERLGAYEPTGMRYPGALAVDGRGRVWVAEVSYLPKRLSVWDADGGLVDAFYGPPKYGGGGVLDPRDSTRFFYATGGKGVVRDEAQRGKGGLLFRLDWQAREAVPAAVYDQVQADDPFANMPGMSPERPVYRDGALFLTNTFNQAYQGMKAVAGLWRWRDDQTIALVGVMGYHGRNPNHTWTEINRPDLRAGWPARANGFFYVWTDQDLDGAVQPAEVQYRPVDQRGLVAVGDDLSLLTSTIAHVDAPMLNDRGVPVYDLGTWRTVADVPLAEGDVVREDGWTVHAGGPLRGYRDGELTWTYHSQWMRRAKSPRPGGQGVLVETSRVLGYPVRPRAGEAGAVWMLNSDKGGVYVFTMDGLLLQTLGGDVRRVPPLRTPEARPGDVLGPFSFGEETFWPTVTQLTESGSIYLAAGKEYTALFRVEGWETVRRLAPWTVELAPDDAAPARRQQAAGTQERRQMTVSVHPAGAVTVDGDLAEWDGADWVTLDADRGLRAAVAVAGDALVVAYRTGRPDLLDNSLADGLPYVFTTGGALDVMLRTRPSRTPEPTPGDVRVVVTRAGDPRTGPVRAARFEQVADHPDGPVTYASPIGEVRFDAVRDVSDAVRLGQEGGDVEVAIPLRVLGVSGRAGRTLGDVGLLLGDGAETLERLYWNNTSASLVSDVPSEARLEPARWGLWNVR